MRLNIRYRLIQFVEIILWLGAAAGAGVVARRVWSLRDEGWRAMLDLAAPGLLSIGAVMAMMIVLIGIYHNTRRNADALDRLARQGAGGMRRLSGVTRGDGAAVAAVVPAPAAVAPAPAAAPIPMAQPVVAAPAAVPAPAPVALPQVQVPPAPAPVTAHVEPAPAPAPAPAAEPVAKAGGPRFTQPMQVARAMPAGARRLGPAS